MDTEKPPLYFVLFRDRVSLGSRGCSQTWNPAASASQVLQYIGMQYYIGSVLAFSLSLFTSKGELLIDPNAQDQNRPPRVTLGSWRLASVNDTSSSGYRDTLQLLCPWRHKKITEWESRVFCQRRLTPPLRMPSTTASTTGPGKESYETTVLTPGNINVIP